MRYPRFDSRANDAMIEEVSRRRCGFGERWDAVNKVCRSYGHHLGELDRKPVTDMPPPPPMPPMEGPAPQNM